MDSYDGKYPLLKAPSHRFEPFSNQFHHGSNPDLNIGWSEEGSLQFEDESRELRRQPYDRARAPKFACLVLFICIMAAATYHTINGFDLDAFAKSASLYSTESKKVKYYDSADFILNHTMRMKDMFQEISRPLLDSKENPVTLPIQLSNLADVSEDLDMENEVPVFWHVPRSGGSLIINIAAYCLDLTQASNIGSLIDPELEALNKITTVVDKETGAKFLNIDTTSPEGMYKAREKNGDVASHPDLDLLITPYIFDAAELLLNNVNRGRMFVMMRHPIERAESMYHSLRKRVDTGAIVGESLLAYAKGHVIENNWMTRFLCNKLGGQLLPDDLAYAKEVLRTKALIGLVKRRNESYQRFKDYFGWQINDGDPKKMECEERYLEWGWDASHYTPIEENSEEWNLLTKSNTFDLKLYEYAEMLFKVQGAILSGDFDASSEPPPVETDSEEDGTNEDSVEIPQSESDPLPNNSSSRF